MAQDQIGNVFLGRNLDWNLPNDLRNITVLVGSYGVMLQMKWSVKDDESCYLFINPLPFQAEFLKGGEVIFTADVTAGFVVL